MIQLKRSPKDSVLGGSFFNDLTFCQILLLVESQGGFGDVICAITVGKGGRADLFVEIVGILVQRPIAVGILVFREGHVIVALLILRVIVGVAMQLVAVRVLGDVDQVEIRCNVSNVDVDVAGGAFGGTGVRACRMIVYRGIGTVENTVLESIGSSFQDHTIRRVYRLGNDGLLIVTVLTAFHNGLSLDLTVVAVDLAGRGILGDELMSAAVGDLLDRLSIAKEAIVNVSASFGAGIGHDGA